MSSARALLLLVPLLLLAPGLAQGGALCALAPEADGCGARYDSGADERAVAVAASPDGSAAFVVAWQGADFVVLAYDAPAMELRWSAVYDAGGVDGANAIATDGARVFVAGASQRAGTGMDALVVAFDAATGAPLWEDAYAGPMADNAPALVLAEGRVHVAAASLSRDSGWDFVLLSYEPTTGERLVESLQVYSQGHDIPSGLAVAAGRAFVAGTTSVGGEDGLVMAFDAATGAPLWTQRYGGAGSDGFRAVATDAAGARVFAAGHAATGGRDLLAASWDAATGGLRWSAHMDGPGGVADEARAIAVDDGRVALAGIASGARACPGGLACVNPWGDAWILVLDAGTGAPSWSRLSAGVGQFQDLFADVALAGGLVVATGMRFGATTCPHQTLLGTPYPCDLNARGGPEAHAYTAAFHAADGALAWDAVLDAPESLSQERAVALAAAGGRVFVAAESVAASGAGDVVTLAYPAGGPL